MPQKPQSALKKKPFYKLHLLPLRRPPNPSYTPSKKTALIYITKENFYRLPGGEIEPRESRFTAASHLAFEEIGCEITVDGTCIRAVEE